MNAPYLKSVFIGEYDIVRSGLRIERNSLSLSWAEFVGRSECTSLGVPKAKQHQQSARFQSSGHVSGSQNI